MIQLIPVNERSPQIINRLLVIWETSVKATHTFLSPHDIESLLPDVQAALTAIPGLYCYFDETPVIQGFIGVDGNKIEMLFIDAAARGSGIGKQLLHYAVHALNASYVDVNEQNQQGEGFYRHMGFRVTSRSPLDAQGRPFPILHMQKQ